MSVYSHADAQDFPSDLDNPFMNPMLRQAQPSMIGLNNPAFMQPQQGPPPHHMGLNPNPNGPNPPMGMLQGGPDMRFPPGHNPMMPRTMSMRPGARLPMNPAGLPPGMPMGGLAHNPQMQGGMGFSPNMMSAPGGMVRRVVSNPSLNPGLGLSGQAMMQQQQIQRQQHQQQQMQMHARQQQQQQREMELAMRNPQNAALARSASASGQLMHSLSQPSSLGQPPHPGGMPPNGFQNQIVPPPQSNSPRARTPVMSMQPGPSQPSMTRAQMAEEMYFQNQNQYPPRNMGNGQFAFGTSPTPPLNMSDSFPPSVGTPRTAAFPPTPAQQLSMQQHGGAGAENGGYPFMAPQRPLSHNNQHHPMQPQHAHSPPGQPQQHHSPHHSDNMNSHPPRPQSQPQSQPPGRPLSGAGPSHTPRPSQQLPNNPGLLPPGRIPPQQPPSQQPNHNPGMRPQSSGGPSAHQQPIAPRLPPGSQPQVAGPVPPPPTSSDGTLMSASASPPDGNALLGVNGAIPRSGAISAQTFAIGYGQGLLRVMQFSAMLGSDGPQVQSQKLNLSYWDSLIREYFTPKAIMKLTLWRDSLKNEAKPFEIGVPILPRFFLVTTQSGVKSMSFTLDGARERLSAPGHAIVECVTAVWTCRYNNGHIVTLRGPLTVNLVICSPGPVQPGASQQNGGGLVLKFDDFEFDAHSHDKYIALEAIAGPRKAEESAQTLNGVGPAAGDEDKKWEEPRLLIENGSIPGEPVNAFGIPQATMRCLELAESVGQMAELISFAKDQEVGPIAALQSFAEKIREEHPQLAMINGYGTNPYFQGSSMPSAQGNTLYSSAPPSVTNPPAGPSNQGQGPSSTMSSPQNAPPSAHNSPQKQHKTIPSKGAASTPSTSTASTGVASNLNTPAMASAPLKRKAGVTDTPTAATEPPPKRTTRRRRTTGGGG
ncbi:LIM-domain binding protein-domain-containing protein [Mycena filopes]|nr:LIM-domain binding protein-domain-containing protein [Mycena filopes]